MIVERIGDAEGVVVVRARGPLTLWFVARLAQLLTGELRRRGAVVVDLRATLPSAGILAAQAALVGLLAAPRRAGGWPLAALHVAVSDEQVAALCRQAGLAQVGWLYATLDDAIRAARAAAPLARAAVRLAADPQSPHRARRLVHDVCADRVPDSVVCDAVLVVSELATNAVRNSLEPFEVASVLTRDRLVVAVRDCSPEPPVMHAPGPWQESGRGLFIVAAVSQEWGVFGETGDGKTVWSSFTLHH